MKKRIFMISIIFLIVSFTVFSQPEYRVSMNIEYSYDTNVFSNPLPMFDGSGNWLTWRQEHPFIKRHNLGMNLGFKYYFSEATRVGLDTALTIKIPFNTISIIPIPENSDLGFSGPWNYHENSITNNSKVALFGAFGPVFRFTFNNLEVGTSVRLSIGGYEYTNNEVILGIQAEPFFNYYFNNLFGLNLKITYDAHFMRFINNENNIYDENYIMQTLAISLGAVFRF